MATPPAQVKASTPKLSEDLGTASFLTDLDKMAISNAKSLLFSNEIPLNPANGGRKISKTDLALGDIVLLSRQNTDIPISLREEAKHVISQAAIYIGKESLAIEDDQGLKELSLSQVLTASPTAVVLRHPLLVSDKAGQLIVFLDEAKGEQKKQLGFAKFEKLLVQISPQHCAAQTAGLQDKCRHFVGRIALGTATNNSFYMGQTLSEAWAKTGLKLSQEDLDWTQTGHKLLPLNYNGALQYIGHLAWPS